MFYTFFRILGMVTGYPIQWLFFKKKVYYEGGKKVNIKKGGKLIISNHFSLWDYGLVCFFAFPRKLTAVTAEAPFKYKIARFGMKFFGTIEANRETKDMSFVETAAEMISKGNLVQIFPEGRNTPDGKMHEFKPSYVLIAQMADCKILPIITDGNYGLFKRVSMIVGNEIHLSEIISGNSKEDILKANEIIYQKAQFLRAELERLKVKNPTMIGHSFGGRLVVLLSIPHTVCDLLSLEELEFFTKKMKCRNQFLKDLKSEA